MELRKNRFLKSVIIILFLLEFLSPAISFSYVLPQEGNTYQINGPTHLNLLINLFSEQLNENEEGREDLKNISLLTQNHPGQTLHPAFILNSVKPAEVYKTCHPYSYSSLLTMYCEYQI